MKRQGFLRVAGPGMLLLAVASLPAADTHLSDLRLGIGLLTPRVVSDATVTVEGSGIGANLAPPFDGNADATQRGQLQYVGGDLSFAGGLIWGGGVAVNRAVWHDDHQDLQTTTPVVNVLLGYGVPMSDRWHAELSPFIGIGRTYLRLEQDGDRSGADATALYMEYGVRAGTFLAFRNGSVLGIEVPFLIGRSTTDYHAQTATGEDVHFHETRRQVGFGILAVIGTRF